MPHVPLESVNLRSVSLAEDSLMFYSRTLANGVTFMYMDRGICNVNYWSPMLWEKEIVYI